MGTVAKKEFCCPLCGSRRYEEIRQGNGVIGPGYSSVLLFCRCSGCSIIFGDPTQFSYEKLLKEKIEEDKKKTNG